MTLDGIVDDLHYLNGRARYADPIAANPMTLRGQIAENDVSVSIVFLSSFLGYFHLFDVA